MFGVPLADRPNVTVMLLDDVTKGYRPPAATPPPELNAPRCLVQAKANGY